MREKLETYLKGLFAGAPDTPRNRELQEEILLNNLEKFDDLVREGTPEAAAFNLVVGELGDVSSLLEEIRGGDNTTAPAPAQPRDAAWYGIMRGILLATAVMLFILSPLPAILLSETDLSSTLAPVLVIAMVALGVGLIVFRAKGLPAMQRSDPNAAPVGDEEGKHEKDPLFAAISGLLWVLILCFYFIISFRTGAWYITWLAFPIGGALEGLVKALFDLIKGAKS